MLKFPILLITYIPFIFCASWFGDFANFASWGNVRYSYLDANRQIVRDPKGGTSMVLKVFYPKGSYSSAPPNPTANPQKGGTGFFIYPLQTIVTGHVQLEYDVLFPADFDFGVGAKLPGLFGGKHTCSGGDLATDCFSARLMWGSNGSGYPYLYVPKNVTHSAEFCSLTNCANNAYGYGMKGASYFVKDKWMTVKELVRLNTPGSSNGRLTVWVDNNVKFNCSSVTWRTTNMVPINGVAFETC